MRTCRNYPRLLGIDLTNIFLYILFKKFMAVVFYFVGMFFLLDVTVRL